MKKFVVLFCIFCAFAHAQIIEVKHFAEVEQYLKNDTLLLLDIDDTLLIPVQMLGSDEWFKERLKKHSLERTLAEWEGIRHLTEMEIVEPRSDQLVKKWQREGRPLMGFTTQGLALATRTTQQLNECGFDLRLSAPTSEDYYLPVGQHGIIFRKGVLFTSATHKGEAFFNFVDALNLEVKHVVFLNDKASHLKQIEEIAEIRGVPFLGLRYAYSDKRKAEFDPRIADIQFKESSFDKILSDDEALQRL